MRHGLAALRASEQAEQDEQRRRGEQVEQRQADSRPAVRDEVLEAEGGERVLDQRDGDGELAEHHGGGEERRREQRRRRFGSITRTVSCPSRAEAARGIDQRAHVDRPDARIDGAVGERHREHHVERHQAIVACSGTSARSAG